MNITVSDNIKSLCPKLTLGIIECHISNSEYDQELWNKINNEIAAFKAQYTIPDINKIPIIQATREAYKKCGKDPNRYRPSSEALSRRVVSGKGLYQITTGVDLVNLISFKTGYSIGALDGDLIEGNLSYGIGHKDEDYNAIARGILNIEGLPILRDNNGGIGTPTSDEERTKISLETSSLLVNINGYLGKEALRPIVEETVFLLKEHLKAVDITIRLIS